MNNSLLPSVSSQLYGFGSIEAISDVNPMLMESKISFCIDTRLCKDSDQFSESYAIPSQSSMYYYQQGPPSRVAIKRLVDYPDHVATDSLTNTSGYSYIPQLPLSPSNKISIQQYEVEFKAMQKGRKRSKSCATEWIRSKKVCFGHEEQWDHQAKEEAREIPSDKVPVRRSQKLSDRITALQKLVSPYGKTDTASVLEEASISIKLLQDQIQLLFDRQNASYINIKQFQLQKSEEKQLDLRGRGLCLVPIPLTRILTEEDEFKQY